MESRLNSEDSKEVLGGLETNFTIPKSDSTDTAHDTLPLFENNQTEVNAFDPNNDQGEVFLTTEKADVSNILRESKSSKIDNGSSIPKDSLSFEELERKASRNRILKSVSFRVEDQEVNEDFDSLSDPSYVSNTNLYNILQNRHSISSIDSFKTDTTTSRRNVQVLENIPEVDENTLEVDAAPGYYGWDGYEARFEESIADHESWSSIPGCIPPWAKSVKKKYGLSPMKPLEEDKVAESSRTMQEQLDNLMKKHKELMLLKRVESKKQLIVKPNKDPNELDTVQMRAKSTRYYMTPLVFDREKKSSDDYIIEKEKVSLPSLDDSNSLSITKKTSRPQAKREISQVLKSLKKNVSNQKDTITDYESKGKKENEKCPKITLNDIREFVNMSPDERKLHEIIKIEKVPSIQDLKGKGKMTSKYIINVPKNTVTDKPTVNIIKIKEKRKLRVDSIENIEEKVTELHYNQGGTRRQGKKENDYSYRESSDMKPIQHIKTKTKSPTETKTFEVKTRQTPVLSPIFNGDKKTEKVLLLQYDKKSKTDKHTTQLVGVKEPRTSDTGEMYLYGSETEGRRVQEKLTTVPEIPPSLKDKVHSIFEELRGMSLKQSVPADMTSSEVQVLPSVDTKMTQRPSDFQATMEVAMVEAKPEVRSASVQVRQSQILERNSDSFVLKAPRSTPLSDSQDGLEEIQPSLDKDKLHVRLDSIVLDQDSLDKPISNDEVIKDEEVKADERVSEQGSLKQLQEVITEYKTKADTMDGVENKSEIVQLEESVSQDEAMKKEEKQTIINDETKSAQSDTAEIPGQILEHDLQEKEITSEHATKEKTEKAQEDTHSELSKTSSKELVQEKSKEIVEQLEEEDVRVSTKDKIGQLSKTSSKVSGQKPSSTLPQDKDLKETLFISGERKMSEGDEKSETFIKTSFLKDFEDIRSYEFGSQQGTDLVITSSSKFVHQKDGLRKKMNWTNDTIFLENNTCPQLIRGLAETALRRPADPIAFLAHWIYKDCESQERTEQEDIRQEHLQLARAMAEVAGGDAKTRKKFNIKKYPIHLVEEDKRNQAFEEGEFSGDNMENETHTNEIIQENL